MSAPVKSGALEGALSSDESKSSDVQKNASNIVGSYEEYLSNRGYEPWRTKTEHSFFKYNPNKFISCLPSLFYKGFNKPPAAGAKNGRLVQRMEKRTIDKEEVDVQIRQIEVDGTVAKPGTFVWANPNREIDPVTKMATENFKAPPSHRSNNALAYDTDFLEMELFQVITAEEIRKVDFQLRGGLLLGWTNYSWVYQKHTYNWGLGSTFEDFCIIWTSFFTLWGFTGLLFYFLLLAHIAGGETANNLWMYCFCMVMGWIVIGISLHARSVVVKRENAEEV